MCKAAVQQDTTVDAATTSIAAPLDDIGFGSEGPVMGTDLLLF